MTHHVLIIRPLIEGLITNWSSHAWKILGSAAHLCAMVLFFNLALLGMHPSFGHVMFHTQNF